MILPHLEFPLEVGCVWKGAALNQPGIVGWTFPRDWEKSLTLGIKEGSAPSGSLIPELLPGDMGSS